MESYLSEMFRETVKKDKDLRRSSEAKPEVGYPTGFLDFDFMNGYIVHVNNPEKNIHEEYYSLGISDGSMVTVIGRSGCGKSTFCTQIAANIVRPYKTACVFEDNIEGGMTSERRRQLSGFSIDEYNRRYIVRNTGINAENFYGRIKGIHDLKLANPDKFTYDTGKLDEYGNPIIKFEPTVYILDSIAMLMPEGMTETDEEDIAGNMAVTGAAKIVTNIMRRIIPMLKMANIILIIVNHILDDISINGRPKKTSLPGLKQGETLPRGKTTQYLANTILRLDDKTRLSADEKYKINGTIVRLTISKSRSARFNQDVPIVFDFDKGFDNELSLLVYLQEQGRVNGAGIGLYFDDRNDMKFSMGNFKEKLQNPEFYKLFISVALNELKKFQTNTEKVIEEASSSKRNITGDILSML